MPRRPRPKRKRTAIPNDLESWYLDLLRFGPEGPAEAQPNDDTWARAARPDWELLDQLWQSHGNRITRTWLTESPLTRPFGWWWLEAPEMRQRTHEGIFEPYDWGDNHHGPKTWFGVPKCFRHPHPRYAMVSTCFRGGCLAQTAYLSQFETEADFLVRLGLIKDETKKTTTPLRTATRRP